MAAPRFTRAPKRSQSDYRNMTHSLLLNHLKTELKKSKDKPLVNKITDFLAKRAWSWFYYYLTSRFGPDHRYPAYTGTDKGIHPLGNEKVKIALAADWATDTTESIAVASEMSAHEPDYTIHLGDTYFVGAPHEITENFLGAGAPWAHGKKGSFAVLGNHEMYARGVAFFKYLLPSIGMKDVAGSYKGQPTSFLALENDYWRILVLDTGYHSIGIPILELLPWFAPDCRFDPILMEWLRTEVKLNNENDKRGLLILTHHQYFTAFQNESQYQAPASLLAGLIGKDRPVLWLWGHEHKLSMFEQAQIGNGITAYGRCIGHGGMPIELDAKEFKRDPDSHGAAKLVMVDQRKKPGTGSYPLGYNGYVMLELSGDALEVSYHDQTGMLFSENWKANMVTGEITGSISPPVNPALWPTEPGKNWDDAVKDQRNQSILKP
jgi:hypothetical protein